MTETDVPNLELLAVALYESDCRERAGDMAKRTTLSRIRAHYSFPSWKALPRRERDNWRSSALTLLAECAGWRAEDDAWSDRP